MRGFREEVKKNIGYIKMPPNIYIKEELSIDEEKAELSIDKAMVFEHPL